MRNLIIVVLLFIASAISQTQSTPFQTSNETIDAVTSDTNAVVDTAKADSVANVTDPVQSIRDTVTAEKTVASTDTTVSSDIDSSSAGEIDDVKTLQDTTAVSESKVSSVVDSVAPTSDSLESDAVNSDTASDAPVTKENVTIDSAVIDSLSKVLSEANTDTLLVLDRGDRKYLSHVIKEDAGKKDSLELVKTKSEESGSTQYLYQILLNGEEKWELSLTTPASDLEDLFVKAAHNQKLREGEQQARERSRGSYQVTPWEETPTIFTEFKPAGKMLDWFAWESGATINFHRNHLYNFNSYAGDTTQIYVDMGRPALYDLRMDLNYTHRFNFVWVGAGIERSWQNSSYFDTVHVVRGGWFSRMGWNIHVALPGFKYELFRDPGVIPFYGQYEDSIYTKLYPGAWYEYTNPLNMIVDTTYKTEPNQYKPDIIDSTIVPYKIAVMPGVGHRFTVKIGYFNYSLVVHPSAYKAPINEVGFQDMPFFKGEWDARLLILPNGRVIPHLEIDAFRTSIDLGPGTLGISPFHFEVEIWGRNHFFVSLGFNAEYLTKKATFRKE